MLHSHVPAKSTFRLTFKPAESPAPGPRSPGDPSLSDNICPAPPTAPSSADTQQYEISWHTQAHNYRLAHAQYENTNVDLYGHRFTRLYHLPPYFYVKQWW